LDCPAFFQGGVILAGHVDERGVCSGAHMRNFLLRVLSLVFGIFSPLFVVVFSAGGKRIHRLFVVVVHQSTKGIPRFWVQTLLE